MFFSTDVLRELVVRAMIFHKKYCSVLVYIAEPLFRVTDGSHIMLLYKMDGALCLAEKPKPSDFKQLEKMGDC